MYMYVLCKWIYMVINKIKLKIIIQLSEFYRQLMLKGCREISLMYLLGLYLNLI